MTEPFISLSMNPEHMTPKHLASKQCAAVRVRLAVRLSYGFAAPFSSTPSPPARFVGHAGGQVVRCTCSPCAINAHRASGFVFSPHNNAPTFPHRAVSTTRSPAPSPGAQTSFSNQVGISLRWWFRISPLSEMRTALFQMQPRLCGERSLKPMWAWIFWSAQVCRRRAMEGPERRRDSWARWRKKAWLSIGAARAA